MIKLKNIRMRSKLTGLFLLAGLIPLALVAWWGVSSSTKALMAKSYAQLEAVREIKKAGILKLFDERRGDMDVLVKTTEMFRRAAFEKLKTVQELKKAQTEVFFGKVRSDILSLSKSQDVLAMYARLRKYHDDMLTGATGPYDISTDEYNEIYGNYSKYLINYVKTHGYYDLFLIGTPHGHVMFTAAREKDLGTNLGHGPYKDESLARLWRKVVRTKDVVIEDFAPYSPAEGSRRPLSARLSTMSQIISSV
ncbi:methyl-accepting chemotaxis protein [Desulfonema ishimotonii]|uniref:Methyl-accepting chemotaxis protein n=1 Tax=Desulfonema ishimotonii TaxID=45657 RepID=A0A401FW77_9BACT|nr:hypothetical protein [Desulfonema ishimotonii]GBC61227.1 methyl-accepting chemotaxis protein [Desulfonema ishimotonii]